MDGFIVTPCMSSRHLSMTILYSVVEVLSVVRRASLGDARVRLSLTVVSEGR